MSLKDSANSKFERYSTGPLYSERELKQVLESLASEGYVKTEEHRTLGMSVYQKSVDGKVVANACLYLDSLGCHPISCGTLILSDDKCHLHATTVWEYAKQKRIEATKNPVMKVLRRLF